MLDPHPAPAEDGTLTALVLDALAYPLFVLRVDGSLLHSNHAGRRALDGSGPLHRADDGPLLPRDAQLRGSFHAALQAAAGGRAQTLHSADGALMALLRPLAAAATPASPSPLLLLAWALPTLDAADGRALSRYYQLTQAEVRVLGQLLAGHGAQQAAQAIGVALSTVRSQILSLRRKTGHRSVPALLAALRALPAMRHGGD